MNSPDHALRDLIRHHSSDPDNPEIQYQLSLAMRRLGVDISSISFETAENCLRILDPEFFQPRKRVIWTPDEVSARSQESNISTSFYLRQRITPIYLDYERSKEFFPHFREKFGHLITGVNDMQDDTKYPEISVHTLNLSITFPSYETPRPEFIPVLHNVSNLQVLIATALIISKSQRFQDVSFSNSYFERLFSSIHEKNQDLHTLVLKKSSLFFCDALSQWPKKFPKLRKIVASDVSPNDAFNILQNSPIHEITVNHPEGQDIDPRFETLGISAKIKDEKVSYTLAETNKGTHQAS